VRHRTSDVARVILEGVTKVFEGSGRVLVRAVSELSLQAEEGECLAMVGPSGSGKTTVLRLISGLEAPTSGLVYLGGKPANDVPPKARDVAMVFQSPSLYPHLTVYDNMAFGLKIRKYQGAEIEQRVRTAADILEISDLLKVGPAELSGGQRQRVAIGRAVVRRAPVLLLDEPLANVEPGLRARLRSDLARLRREYRPAMIYVTHDHQEALMVGDRVAVLRNGLLQQVADPLHLYQCPANLFVASFVGSPAMNLFRGQLQRQGEIYVFEPATGADSAATATKRPGLRLPARLSPQLQKASGRSVVLGVRPEHIEVATGHDGAPGCWHLEARVVSAENVGPDKFLHAACPAGSFVARVAMLARVEISMQYVFNIDSNHACLFDEATGQAMI